MSNGRTTEERILHPANGILMLFVIIAVLIVSVALLVTGGMNLDKENYSLGVPLMILSPLLMVASCVSFAGLKVVNPNEAAVLSLFGKYYGTIYESGFWFVNPFASAMYPAAMAEEIKKARREAATKSGSAAAEANQALTRLGRVSTKLCTFVNGTQKVNDKLGNPVEVSAIVIWRVVDATKAILNVDYYKEYLSNQTDSTIRNVARLYPYDVVDDNDDGIDDNGETTLRGSAKIVADQMKAELAERVKEAGIEIVEVRLNQIAYATEIAAAMLQRQQAIAIIAARKKIVEGAVSMVEMALNQLKADGVVELDEERKAQMVSNLLVVLCGSKEANPVVNAGSIY